MAEFLQNNWIWILLIVFFIWMHGSGMGCGGHGGHGEQRKRTDETDEQGKGGSHQH